MARFHYKSIYLWSHRVIDLLIMCISTRMDTKYLLDTTNWASIKIITTAYIYNIEVLCCITLLSVNNSRNIWLHSHNSRIIRDKLYWNSQYFAIYLVMQQTKPSIDWMAIPTMMTIQLGNRKNVSQRVRFLCNAL